MNKAAYGVGDRVKVKLNSGEYKGRVKRADPDKGGWVYTVHMDTVCPLRTVHVREWQLMRVK